jgi:hypothetical protein
MACNLWVFPQFRPYRNYCLKSAGLIKEASGFVNKAACDLR